jgi:8-oxo-dGTP diphosphatase
VKIKTAAKSLICDEGGKVLLLVRSGTDSHAPGRYDFPGGGVDSGEDIAAGASRELFEETGLSIPPSKLVPAYCHTNLDAGKEHSINRIFFIGRTSQPEVKLSNEHSEFMWVTLDEAIEMYDHFFYGPAMKHIREHNLLSNLQD